MISDLDDTVIQTDVTRVIRMVRNTLLGNARTRHPFPGVAALYRALHSSAGAPANPLFYVSSSPWNLYDMLDDFFRLRSIPEGPIFLRDWGLSSKDRSSSGYKLAVIRPPSTAGSTGRNWTRSRPPSRRSRPPRRRPSRPRK